MFKVTIEIQISNGIKLIMKLGINFVIEIIISAELRKKIQNINSAQLLYIISTDLDPSYNSAQDLMTILC